MWFYRDDMQGEEFIVTKCGNYSEVLVLSPRFWKGNNFVKLLCFKLLHSLLNAKLRWKKLSPGKLSDTVSKRRRYK